MHVITSKFRKYNNFYKLKIITESFRNQIFTQIMVKARRKSIASGLPPPGRNTITQEPTFRATVEEVIKGIQNVTSSSSPNEIPLAYKAQQAKFKTLEMEANSASSILAGVEKAQRLVLIKNFV